MSQTTAASRTTAAIRNVTFGLCIIVLIATFFVGRWASETSAESHQTQVRAAAAFQAYLRVKATASCVKQRDIQFLEAIAARSPARAAVDAAQETNDRAIVAFLRVAQNPHVGDAAKKAAFKVFFGVLEQKVHADVKLDNAVKNNPLPSSADFKDC